MNPLFKKPKLNMIAISDRFRWLIMLLAMACISVATNQRVEGQMPQDVRDIFEGMLDSLDQDIQKRFRKAIDDNTTQVEFSPGEFKRFRSHPVNPFEGLDKIKLDRGQSKIVLNFELPSMRNRKIQSHERQHQSLLRPLRATIAAVSSSTVKIFGDGRQVAMGVVVESDGYVLTKLSEIENRKRLRVQLANGTRYPAKVLKSDPENDLVIVKIPASDLPVVNWSNTQPMLGAFLVTPSPSGPALAIGSYSVRPRSTREGEQAFLGVQPIVTENGVRIEEIQPGTASYNAGLKNGDVIVELAGRSIMDVSSLVRAIREHRPGDQVKIAFRRNGQTQSTTATLAGAGIGGERAARFKMMNRLGAVPSRRDGNFPNVFQHDTPLFPEHCGGPIVDLDGQVVGLNIARKGRAASFALPSGYVRTLVDDLLRNEVAAKSQSALTK